LQEDEEMKRLCGTILKSLIVWLNRSAAWLSTLSFHLTFVHFKNFVFAPRPSDIFVVSYPRSGTTWLQMIVYQILTDDAELPFSHISEVMPWFERKVGVARFVPLCCKRGEYRVFKSHLSYRRPSPTIPKGPCKYIYVMRDGRDVALSYYRFYQSHMRFQGSFEDFFPLFMRGDVQYGSWFEHVAGWQSARERLDVLFLSYEEMLKDLFGTIRRVAQFCGVDLTEEELERIAGRCTFEFMKRHEDKFDHGTEVMMGLSIKPGQFIRAGEAGHGKAALSEAHAAAFGDAYTRWFGKTPSELAGAVVPDTVLRH
jgi:hypothetical protein